jgi:hypothetical protein
MELTESLLASLLVERIILIGLVEVLLFLLKLSAVLEHGRNLLRVEEIVGLAEGASAAKGERILAADAQTIKQSWELVLAADKVGA